ncbi:MAG TPA: branched-chain amino acid ABC transporter permease [Bacillota bacterium]
MAQFGQALLGGVTTGSIYALVGIGLVMIFKMSRVLNLAQGEFLILGALFAYTLVGLLPLWLACLLAVVGTFVIGLLFERLAVRPVRGSTLTVLLVITLGTSILLKGAAMLIWGKEPMSLPSLSGNNPLQVAGLFIPPQGLWILGGIAVTGLILRLFFDRTLLGKAMVATAENPTAAGMTGINTIRLGRLAFGLSGAIGGLAGVLIAPLTFISYDGGTLIGLKGFVAAALGGMYSIPGAVAGGLLLGALEALGAGYVSSIFKDVTAFVVLIVLLVVRSGLDKRKTLLEEGLS